MKKIAVDHVIKNGKHMMIFNRSDEVSEIIHRYLEKLS